MKRHLHLVIVLVLIAANAVIGWTVYQAFAQGDQPGDMAGESASEQLALEELIQDAIVRIKRNYVEPVPTKTLVYGAIKGMVGELDPHSHFLEPRVYEEMKVSTRGEFGGLGIEITKRDDGFVTIIAPIYNTPAYRKGLLPGDRIIKIEGEELRDPDINDVVDKLRGDPGTSVTITIWRIGREPFDVTITREVIEVPSIVDPHLIDDGIGYVKLTQFQEDSADELDKALTQLERQGMDALILDLRDNPGGLLTAAIGVCGLFIDADPEPRVLVSIRGRDGDEQPYKSRNSRTHPNYPVVVLINGASASASEIVAGAMKDLGRGILIGTTSYGKGSVQTVIPLRQDTALSLTTAHYYTPAGILIHGKGIQPDIEVKVTAKEELERRRQKLLRMEENIKNGPTNGPTNGTTNGPESELENGGEANGGNGAAPSANGSPESLTNGSDSTGDMYNDRQLQRAIDVLKAIKVLRAGQFSVLSE